MSNKLRYASPVKRLSKINLLCKQKSSRIKEENVLYKHSHSMKNGLETHEKGIVVCFYDVFFVGMCTLVRSRHMGKPNLNNACLF